jgi:TolB protein
MKKICSMVWMVAVCLLLPHAATSASPSEIAYARLTDGYWQLWIYDVDAKSHRQVTTSPVDKRDPVWTPEGAILFRTHAHHLYEIKPGGAEMPIFSRSWPALDPAWSPDRKRVALAGLRTDVKDESAIWVLSDGGKTRRIVTRGPDLRTHPTWSPDGKSIIYVHSLGTEGSSLVRMASDGSGEQELLRDAFHSIHPQWSPDGRSIAYATNRSGDYELIVRDLETGTEKQLTNAPGLDVRPCWSPDGRRIVFSTFRRDRLEIWTMESDGSAAAPLFTVSDEVSDPAWR